MIVDCIKTWGAQRIHLILKIVVWEIWCVFLAASFSHCVWSLKDVRRTSVKTKAAFFSTSREIMSNTFSYKVTRSLSPVRVGGWRFPSCQFVTCAIDWQLLTLNRTCLFMYIWKSLCWRHCVFVNITSGTNIEFLWTQAWFLIHYRPVNHTRYL